MSVSKTVCRRLQEKGFPFVQGASEKSNAAAALVIINLLFSARLMGTFLDTTEPSAVLELPDDLWEQALNETPKDSDFLDFPRKVNDFQLASRTSNTYRVLHSHFLQTMVDICDLQVR